MGLFYAGVHLSVCTPQLAASIEQRISVKDVYDFQRVDWPTEPINWTFPGSLKYRPVRIGTIYWPTASASRWATGYFLATGNQLSAIRAAIGSQYSKQPLRITQEDQTRTTVSAVEMPMWMLPPRPLTGFNFPLYLLTLVDDRYFWWFRDTGDIIVQPGTTTWSQLYNSIGNAIGVNITPDNILAAYGKPTASLTSHFEQSPIMLDAVAYNVGHRIVVNLDGTVNAYAPATSQAILAQNLLTSPPRMGGGTFKFTPGVLNDLQAMLPGSVRVVFPRANPDGTAIGSSDLHSESASVYAVTVTLASLNLPDLGTIGNSSTKTFGDTAAALGATGVPSNAATLQSLVQQIATDWYRYQLGSADIQFGGIVPWQPEGLSDAIEWTYNKGDVTTRILRPAWNDLTEELLHGAEPRQGPPSPATFVSNIGGGGPHNNELQSISMTPLSGGTASSQSCWSCSWYALSGGIPSFQGFAWVFTLDGSLLAFGTPVSGPGGPTNGGFYRAWQVGTANTPQANTPVFLVDHEAPLLPVTWGGIAPGQLGNLQTIVADAGLVIDATNIIFGPPNIVPPAAITPDIQPTQPAFTRLNVTYGGIYQGASGTDGIGNIFISGLCVNVGGPIPTTTIGGGGTTIINAGGGADGGSYW